MCRRARSDRINRSHHKRLLQGQFDHRYALQLLFERQRSFIDHHSKGQLVFDVSQSLWRRAKSDQSSGKDPYMQKLKLTVAFKLKMHVHVSNDIPAVVRIGVEVH